MRLGVTRLLPGILLLAGSLAAQNPPQQQPGTPAPQGRIALGNPQIDQLRASYVLHIGDQILVRASELDDVSERPFRIDGDGFIDLPVLGRVKADGVSVEDLEKTLVELARKYVRQPQVTVTVVQFSSEPVFFVGAFKAPGIYPLGGNRTLIEMMSSIGGLAPSASHRIKVTRRKEYGAIPLANAVATPDASGTAVEISMATLRDNVNPAEDIVLQPFDVISVEQAEMVYVLEQGGRAGAFPLGERDSMSVLQALVMAGGIGGGQQSQYDLKPAAIPKKVWILRPLSNTALRAKVPVNLEMIIDGENNDAPLFPNDILYIPKSNSGDLGRTLLVALPTVFGIVNLILTLTR